MARVGLEDLRVLDRFLVFAASRGIESPSAEDFLAFSEDTGSTRRLRSLEAALLALLPGNPAVLLVLREAIRRKAPPRTPATSRAPRKVICSVPLEDMPASWQEALLALRQGDAFGGFEALALSTVKSMEEVLRAYVGTLAAAGLTPELGISGIRLHEDALRIRRRARPTTLHIATLRLRQFAQRTGEDAGLIEALRCHEKSLRRSLSSVVPLKEARLAALPEMRACWRHALALLALSRRRGNRSLRARQRNKAFALAFWMLIPLRLEDGRLL
ncbi:hypothetical protein [Rhodobacter sp. NSM]|uniref:hypothetical protein n=1 Tax=Rhodobacter sp. NSM TaxID=3457501 RepID=UPI003FD39FA5